MAEDSTTCSSAHSVSTEATENKQNNHSFFSIENIPSSIAALESGDPISPLDSPTEFLPEFLPIDDPISQRVSALLTSFKEKLTARLSSQHHEKVENLRAKIASRYEAITRQPKTDEVNALTAWFKALIKEQEVEFSDDFSIWKNIVKPLLNWIAGAILSILLSPVMLLHEKTATWVGSFFALEPNSAGKLNQEASQLENSLTEITNELATISQAG